MSAIADVAQAGCVFVCASMAWSALIAACANANGRKFEGWDKYWLVALALAVLPPFLALGFWLAPSPAPILEFDLAAGASGLAPEPVSAVRAHARSENGPAFWALLLLAFYAGGAVWRLVELVRQKLRTRQVVEGARAVSVASAAHLKPGIVLLLSDRPVTPFCIGGARKAIVLSQAVVTALTPAQVSMVIAHEARHLSRGDPFLFTALGVLEALHWPNLFVRALAARVRLAAEIECDAAASGASPRRRALYAQALVCALEAIGRQDAMVAGLGGSGEAARIRLAHIAAGVLRRRRRAAWAGLAALACLVGVTGAALAAPSARVLALTRPAFGFILKGRISQAYGERSPFSAFHTGIDVAAPAGSPIAAPEQGRVVFAGEDFRGESHWGKAVLVRHAGGWLSFYAHLGAVSVRSGEYVRAGQQIGLVGNTGVSTGPHLHLEMLHDGVRVDPGTLGVAP